ncbi:MAG TPA: nucleotidyltransferase domain-containing protein [Longimicrobiaceae bacterium]|nr:nucleotidyltransferase domain-containing protein [Longimicrobiaceae bacterium]
MGNEIRRAEELARDLVRTYGEGVVSVVLYGSAARGDFHEGVSDLNVLVLLRDPTPEALRRGSALARAWVAEGNPPPLVMGVEEWRRSADVFPIELSDMREAHRMLHGEDPFAGIQIDPDHLRLQCENELKGKHIQLRERYLLSAAEPEELGQVLKKSLSTFLVLFRAVLRLLEEEGVREPEQVILRTAARSGFDPAPLLEILRARREARRFHPDADSRVVVGYLDAVAHVVDFVDRLPAAGGRAGG